MAPEVLVTPPEKYNLKADVYSFGIVLWEMLSLKSPYSHVRSKSELVGFVGEHNVFSCCLSFCDVSSMLRRIYPPLWRSPS